MSELALAAIVAGATCVGAVVGPIVSNWLPSADATHQSTVQLIEIAVGVLATPKPDGANGFSAEARALREWSVDTINAAATDIKIKGKARDSLINGSTVLPITLSLTPAPRRTVTQSGKPWEYNANKNKFILSEEDLENLRRQLQESAPTE